MLEGDEMNITVDGLKIYDTMRQFHKNELLPIMDKYKLGEWEKNALETLSGVLYLVEYIFYEPKKLEKEAEAEKIKKIIENDNFISID